MMGELSRQGNLFGGDHLHLDFVGRGTFYAWLALEGPRVFPDGDFRDFYVLDNGRRSVPPSQMLRMVLLQWYEQVSDEEAVMRSKFDLRWKVALGLEDHEGLCAKFTLQTFRGKLLLSGKGRALLTRSVRVCRETGVLRSRKVRAALDTSPIIGRGAVKDTYNLVADGMVKLLWALAAFETPLLEPVKVEPFAREHDLSRYVTGASLKGGAELDWNDESAREAFLTGLVVDVRRAVGLGKSFLAGAASGGSFTRSAGEKEVREAMALLEQLVEQDIEVREDGGAALKQGVAKDRIISVHDPEMRHGRKSKMVRFDGHKGEIVVDTASGTILDASSKAGNAHDAHGSLEAIERAEESLKAAWEDAPEEPGPEEESQAQIVETLGDCAYGSAENRRDFCGASRALTAKQAPLHNGGRYTKNDFVREEQSGARTCPAGHRVLPRLRTRVWRDEKVKVPYYEWPASVCAACPLRAQCLKACKDKDAQAPVRGRTLSEHPEEELLAKARAQQHTPAFRDAYRKRQTVEHRLARMMQLGARQARYVGRAKTELQWLIAATVANLTLALGLGNRKKTSKAPSMSQTAQDKAAGQPLTTLKAFFGCAMTAIQSMIAPSVTSSSTTNYRNRVPHLGCLH
ncbi:MAG: transposase [Candidatus Hydrogenedentes bacterium]|nr:transposase [Candidatus Hydrogenedentota bacterium]